MLQIESQHCNCSRNIPKPKKRTLSEHNILFNQTTCSLESFNRGFGQKIVSFSYYKYMYIEIDNINYIEDIQENLNLMSKYYPGWIMRVYIDIDDISYPFLQDLCKLVCKNPILDICNIKNLPGTPYKNSQLIHSMNWKFFPTLDPQVKSIIFVKLQNYRLHSK